MVTDVAAGTFSCLPVGGRRTADGDRAQPLQPGRDEVGDVAGQDGEKFGQVRAVPVAGQIGLAEADQAGGAEPAEERPWPVQEHDRGSGGSRSEQPTVGEPY